MTSRSLPTSDHAPIGVVIDQPFTTEDHVLPLVTISATSQDCHPTFPFQNFLTIHIGSFKPDTTTRPRTIVR